MKTDWVHTSNGRFAVDREFEYIESVSSRPLVELFGPSGELVGPPRGVFEPTGELFGAPGGVRKSDDFLWKYVFHFLGKFGPGNQNPETKQKMRFQFLGKSGLENQIYMKNGGRFPATSEEIHYNYKLKWASRNSPGIPGIPGNSGHSSGNGKIVQLQPTLPHAPGARITVVLTNSLKLILIIQLIN